MQPSECVAVLLERPSIVKYNSLQWGRATASIRFEPFRSLQWKTNGTTAASVRISMLVFACIIRKITGASPSM
jgi:hypothetical protein